MAYLKLSAIFCMYTSITSKIDFKVFELSDKFQSVPSYVKVGIAEVSLLKKTIIFVLSVFESRFVSVQLKPFKTCVVIEFVQLEVQTFSCV